MALERPLSLLLKPFWRASGVFISAASVCKISREAESSWRNFAKVSSALSNKKRLLTCRENLSKRKEKNLNPFVNAQKSPLQSSLDRGQASFCMARSRKVCAVFTVSFLLCTKMSTWFFPAFSMSFS